MSDELIGVVRDEAEDRMEKAVAHTRQEFAGVRSGRASSGLVEKIPVDYYGTIVPLQQLASFSIPEARMLVISPFDKGSMGAIEKSLRDANLGLNPSNDGSAIRLNFPPLTEERRKEYVRMVKQKAEDGRTAVRARPTRSPQGSGGVAEGRRHLRGRPTTCRGPARQVHEAVRGRHRRRPRPQDRRADGGLTPAPMRSARHGHRL